MGHYLSVRWLDTALVAWVVLRNFADVVRWSIESGVEPPHSESFFSALLDGEQTGRLSRISFIRIDIDSADIRVKELN